MSWREARDLARAMAEGFDLVKRLGNSITPAPMETLSRLPEKAVAALLWAMSRVPAMRKAGAAGPSEPRALIDAMSAAAPGQTAALLALRP